MNPILCRLCNISLTDNNWLPSSKRSSSRICIQCIAIERKQYKQTLKKKAFHILGNRCICCNEIRVQFLTIDHINGGGHQHRKRLKGGLQILHREVIKLGPGNNKYRLLCMNCNWSYGKFNYCPHKIIPKTIIPVYNQFQGQKGICRDCGIKLTPENIVKIGKQGGKSWLCKPCNCVKNKQRRVNTRVTVIRTYGGKCACCAEDHIEFLVIDHIDGNGAIERQITSSSKSLYTRIIKNYQPEKYRVLCSNCNWAKGMYGYCHE